MTIRSTTIYLTDNGRALCGAHLGVTARMTGRDLSGQRIAPVTVDDATFTLSQYGYIPACEQCGRAASLVAGVLVS